MSVYFKYESPMGNMTFYSRDEKRLWGIWLDGQKYDRSLISQNENMEYKDIAVFDQTKHYLDLYFSGKIPDFTPDLALTGSSFKKQVSQALLSIPYGTTVTYGDIARQVGCRSSQAVGQAIGHNPILIIVPCHRVISADGRLTGYAAGVEKKQWLLEFEKNVLSHNKNM